MSMTNELGVARVQNAGLVLDVAEETEVLVGEIVEAGEVLAGEELRPGEEQYLAGVSERRMVPVFEERGTQKVVAELLEAGVTPTEMRAIILHVQGVSRRKIMELTGMSTCTSTKLFSKAAVRKYIRAYMEDLDGQLESLYQLSISAVRDALVDPDMKIRLEAAKHMHKVLGKDRGIGNEDGATAEDVIQAIMKVKTLPSGEEEVTREIRGTKRVRRDSE